jgi:ATP-binding cassette subfamily B multidrug efflux pump
VSNEQQNNNSTTQPAGTSKVPPSGGGGGITGKALDWTLLMRVMHYVKPYKKTFYLAVFLTIFLAASAIVQPLLIQKTIDDYILKDNYGGLIFMVELMLGQLIIQTVAQYYQTFINNWLGDT